MKREIKFRGQKEDGSFVYGNLIKGLNGECYILQENKQPIKKNGLYWYIDSPCFLVKTNTIGQFTGLKDVYDIPIYESDILEFHFDLGIAIVINDGFRFAVKSPGSEAVDYEGEDVLKQTRVIGNIHQNPELL